MIQYGRQACFLRDKKGFLPIHVACSRHCSPEKLGMLLEANPASLFAETDDGRTILVLAKTTASPSHPNYTLIAEIERRIASSSASPSKVMCQFSTKGSQDSETDYFNEGSPSFLTSTENNESAAHNLAATQQCKKGKPKPKRKRKATITKKNYRKGRNHNSYKQEQEQEDSEPANLPSHQENAPPIKQEDSEPANLLLHFSRHMMENVTSV